MSAHREGEPRGYGHAVVVRRPFAETIDATRGALAEQGFGVLTEIDMAATMKAKLDVDLPPQVILGACNPPIAYRALQVEESIGLLLPCNVVVRAVDEQTTSVQVLDPQVMVAVTDNPALAEVADDAAGRLDAMLASLSEERSSVLASYLRASTGRRPDAVGTQNAVRVTDGYPLGYLRTRHPTSEETPVCSPARCRACGKVTWSGCGMHASAVLASVPPAQRCDCR